MWEKRTRDNTQPRSEQCKNLNRAHGKSVSILLLGKIWEKRSNGHVAEQSFKVENQCQREAGLHHDSYISMIKEAQPWTALILFR